MIRTEVLQEIVQVYKESGCNQQEAARRLGLPRTTFQSRLNTAIDRGLYNPEPEKAKINHPKLLFWDIEMSKELSARFPSKRPQHQNPCDTFLYQFIISVHWKWSHEDKVHNYSVLDTGDEYYDDLRVVKKVISLLEQADYAVAHYGDNFDVKQVLQRAMYHRLPPYREPVYIDTYKLANKAKFPSHKLGQLCRYLSLEHKLGNNGDWWNKATIHGCQESLRGIVGYGDGDIPTLESLYYHLRPYLTRFHPNMNLIANTSNHCPVCLSDKLMEMEKLKPVGKTSLVLEYKCHDCGALSRGGRNQRKGEIIR